MVTKRVHKRQLLLIEDPYVTQVILYTLAYCLDKYKMKIHAAMVEGNHMHKVTTDELALRPDFLRDFYSLLARQLNRHYGEGDALFSNKQANIVHNVSPEDVVRRIAYVMGNPVADGIEREGKNHKGTRMRWPQPDMVIKRPEGFFRSKEQGGSMPDEVTLRFSRPPGFDDLSDEELDALIEEQVLAYEEACREQRDAEGLPFRCDHSDTQPDPKSFPKTPHELFRLAPLIGAAVKAEREEALARLQQFRAAHKEARKRVLKGETDVVFPFGTFQAVRQWNVLVEPAPT